MGADMIGVRVGNAAGFAVDAAVKSQNGIEQSDGFVVGKQSWFMKSGVLNESLSLLRRQIFPGDKPAKNFFQLIFLNILRFKMPCKRFLFTLFSTLSQPTLLL
jgi:hypothetical protein